MISRYGIFCKVIETKSFTRAAEEIGYSQSAVSQTVKALEKELGTALVHRDKSGVTLTKDGQAYFPYFREISSAEQALSQKRDEMQGLENSLITIGAFTSVTQFLLPPVIGEFKKKYPKCRFNLPQGRYDDIARWILNREVDFGFIDAEALSAALADSVPGAAEALTVTPLSPQRLKAVFPKDHPLAEKDTVTLEELGKEPLILDMQGSFNLIMNAFHQAGIEPQVEHCVSNDDSILAMLEQGLGVAALFSPLLKHVSPGLAVREISDCPARTLSLAWSHWDTMSLASRRFIRLFLERAPYLDFT